MKDILVQWHPRHLPIPPGWKDTGVVSVGHHSHYSILIEKEDVSEAEEDQTPET